MVPTDTIDRTVDPVEVLRGAIEYAWISVSRAYEASACLPDMQTLFADADLTRPNEAAEGVLLVMLQEVIESIGRFSPWYKQPARAFGLVSVRDARTNRAKWVLAPEAVQRWQGALQPLAYAIRRYSGLIQAMMLVDDLMADMDANPCVSASCRCIPPNTIQVRKSVLENCEITCERCMQPFT